MPSELVKLAEQSFQGWPAFEINDFAGAFVQCRAVVLGVIDIKTHVDYSLLHRRLPINFSSVVR